MTSESAATATGVNTDTLKNLKVWNISLSVLHLGQALAMLLLTNDFALKVLTRFLMGLQERKDWSLKIYLKSESAGLLEHF